MVRHMVLLTAALAVGALGTPARALVGVDTCAAATQGPHGECTIVMTGGAYTLVLQSQGVDAWSSVACGDGTSVSLAVPNPDPAYGYWADTTFTTSLTTCTLNVSSAGLAVAWVYR